MFKHLHFTVLNIQARITKGQNKPLSPIYRSWEAEVQYFTFNWFHLLCDDSSLNYMPCVARINNAQMEYY